MVSRRPRTTRGGAACAYATATRRQRSPQRFRFGPRSAPEAVYPARRDGGRPVDSAESCLPYHAPPCVACGHAAPTVPGTPLQLTHSLFYQRTAMSRTKASMLLKGRVARPADAVTPEDALVRDLEKFLLELGSDFASSDDSGGCAWATPGTRSTWCSSIGGWCLTPELARTCCPPALRRLVRWLGRSHGRLRLWRRLRGR